MKASPKDTAKLKEVLHSVFKNAGTDQIITHLNTIFVRHRAMYEACKFQSLRACDFADEVDDALSANEICDQYGIWVFAEFGDGYSVFHRLCSKSAVGTANIIAEMTEAGTGMEFIFNAPTESTSELEGWYLDEASAVFHTSELKARPRMKIYPTLIALIEEHPKARLTIDQHKVLLKEYEEPIDPKDGWFVNDEGCPEAISDEPRASVITDDNGKRWVSVAQNSTYTYTSPWFATQRAAINYADDL